MDDLPQLTQDENSALRVILERHRAQHLTVEVSEQMPVAGRILGKVGHFVVYALCGVATILSVLLIPESIEQACNFYRPKVAWTAIKVEEVLGTIGQDVTDGNPPPGDYLVLHALPAELPAITGDQVISPTGIHSAEAFGIPQVVTFDTATAEMSVAQPSVVVSRAAADIPDLASEYVRVPPPSGLFDLPPDRLPDYLL